VGDVFFKGFHAESVSEIEEKGNVGLGNRDTALGAGCCCESLKAED